MTSPSNSPAFPDPALESFSSRAVPRILRTMAVVSVLALLPIGWFYGWAGAVGGIAGAAVSYINFRVLARGVEALVDRVVDHHSQEKGRVILFRFLLRYGLVAIIAYAIFKGSALAFRGFLWGLCMPVAAMMIEAAAEAWVAFRRS